MKLWLSADPEPAGWLLTRDLSPYPPPVDPIHPVINFANDGALLSTAWFDDFVFSDAPILPNLPPPPETEHNPPYLNGDEAGDPVSTFTGTYSDSHLDVAIPGRGPAIQLSRAYNSNDTRATTLGPGWTHSYNIRLTSPEVGSEDIVLVGPQGRSDRYVESAGSFAPPTGIHRTLVRNADETYTATDRVQTEWRFDPSGRLTQIRDRYGNASNLSYDSSDGVARIGTAFK